MGERKREMRSWLQAQKDCNSKQDERSINVFEDASTVFMSSFQHSKLPKHNCNTLVHLPGGRTPKGTFILHLTFRTLTSHFLFYDKKLPFARTREDSLMRNFRRDSTFTSSTKCWQLWRLQTTDYVVVVAEVIESVYVLKGRQEAGKLASRIRRERSTKK